MGIVQVTAREEPTVSTADRGAVAAGQVASEASETSEAVVAASIGTTRQTVPWNKRTRTKRRSCLRALPIKARRAALFVPAISTLLCLCLLSDRLNITPSRFDLGLMFMIGGPIFACISGVLLRSKRLGALSGFLMGTGVIAAIWMSYPEPLTLRELLRACLDWYTVRYLLNFLLGGALAGMSGALLRQGIQQLRQHQVRVVTNRMVIE